MPISLKDGFYICECENDTFNQTEDGEGVTCRECEQFHSWDNMSYVGIKIIEESTVGETK